MRRSLCVCSVVAALIGCESFSEVLGPIPYTATLSGNAVRPGTVTTDATGTLMAALNQTTLRWSYTVLWTDLSSAPTSVHLHGPADASGVADVLVDFGQLPEGSAGSVELAPAGRATGELDLTRAVTPTVSGDSVRTLLNAGRVYIDVHSVNHASGEIRGQLVRH